MRNSYTTLAIVAWKACSLIAIALIWINVLCDRKLYGDLVLDFSLLPSAQGFNYDASGNGSGFAESQIFAVDGNRLTMNTLTLPLGSPGHNYYRHSNIVVEQDPFVLEWHSRVLQDEGTGSFGEYGFFTAVSFGSQQVAVGMGTETIVVSTGSGDISSSLDNTILREFRIESNPSTGWSLFVDEVLLYENLSFASASDNSLSFGDGTGDKNSLAELEFLRFSQVAVPEPGSFLAIAATLPLIGLRRTARRIIDNRRQSPMVVS